MNAEGYKRARIRKISRFSLQNIFKCLEDPDYPSAGPFLRFMNLTGNWHPNMKLKSTRFKELVFYVTVTVFFSQYVKFLTRFDMSGLLLFLQMVPYHLAVLKCILFRKDYTNWEKLINYISRTERQQLSEKDDDIIDILDDYIKRSRIVIYLFWIIGFICDIGNFSAPYKENKIVENGTDVYVNLFDFYFPFKQNEPPGYYYSIVLQTIFGNIMSAYVISWDSLVYSTMMFFAGQLRISRVYCMKAVDPESKGRSHENIIKCHRFHSSLVEHQKLFQQLISTVLFVTLIMGSINLGICIVQITKSTDNLSVMLSAAIYVFGILVQLLIFSWFSNEVTIQSSIVSSGVFESNWIATDAAIHKEVLILQLATSKRLAFRAGPTTEMSLDTFVGILKASYSLFTLLKETK